jgi:CubicO group peptidase (beta-lactamase class C family)
MMQADPQSEQPEDRWRETIDYASALTASAPGVCIAMARIAGDEVATQFVGECAPDSLFQIGSITKTFTGTLLADAIIDKRLEFDTTVADLLGPGSVSAGVGAITVEQLATHRSGLPRIPDNLLLDPRHIADPYAAYDEGRLLEFLAAHTPAHAPGELDEYSKLGLGLLGYLLAKVYD